MIRFFAVLFLATGFVRAAELPKAFAGVAVGVAFNPSYRGLIEDNEKAGAADPRQPVKLVRELLGSAKKSLDVCVYDVGDPGMIAALVAAKDRGVKVRVVTERDNTFERDVPGKVREFVGQLESAGVPLVTDLRSGLMHFKFVVADGEVVWFGSMNWTKGGLFRDNNNSVFVKSREVAEVFGRQFDSLFERKEFTRGIAGTTKPIRVGDAEISIHFSPQAGSQAATLAELGHAKSGVRFMVFAFTDRDIGNLLTKKIRAGVAVQGVFDQCQIDRYSEYRWMTKNGAKTWQDGNQSLMHHKTMLVDDEVVITGSYNFTKSAEQNNNEVLAVIRSPRVAQEYRAEFDRLVFAAENNGPLPPYDHPACQERGKQPAKPEQPVPR